MLFMCDALTWNAFVTRVIRGDDTSECALVLSRPGQRRAAPPPPGRPPGRLFTFWEKCKRKPSLRVSEFRACVLSEVEILEAKSQAIKIQVDVSLFPVTHTKL
jgi:hypothetical protein